VPSFDPTVKAAGINRSGDNRRRTGHASPFPRPTGPWASAGKPDFGIGDEGGLNSSFHSAITAKDRAAVDAFYRAAIAAGGKDKGVPGPRPLSRELLWRVRIQSRRPQHRSGLPRAA
jgi:hypothetical protein